MIGMMQANAKPTLYGLHNSYGSDFNCPYYEQLPMAVVIRASRQQLVTRQNWTYIEMYEMVKYVVMKTIQLSASSIEYILNLRYSSILSMYFALKYPATTAAPSRKIKNCKQSLIYPFLDQTPNKQETQIWHWTAVAKPTTKILTTYCSSCAQQWLIKES